MIRTTILIAVALAVGGATSPIANGGSAVSHWCRKGDPPIQASLRTSCPFAGRIVSVYIQAGAPKKMARFVRSPVTHKRYWIVCSRQDTRVFCSNRRYGIWLRFSWFG